MNILVTGSAGHLGEALARTLRERGDDVTGVDRLPSPFTTHVGSIVDRAFVASAMKDVDIVLHAATLHKPHVATHSRQDFIDVNITGALNLLEESAAGNVKAFVFTSTTSVFGDARDPAPHEPAAWINESVTPIPKNIYGVTKAAAEDLCQLFHRNKKLPCLVLRTSRFFPEADDSREARESFADANLKTNEFLHRRVDIEDVVSAHLAAMERAEQIGFSRYIISATTPFRREDAAALRHDAPAILSLRAPGHEEIYAQLGWRIPPALGRIYDNAKARAELGWAPRHDFFTVVRRVEESGDWRSPLARTVGAKGYHAEIFAEGPFPVE